VFKFLGYVFIVWLFAGNFFTTSANTNPIFQQDYFGSQDLNSLNTSEEVPVFQNEHDKKDLPYEQREENREKEEKCQDDEPARVGSYYLDQIQSSDVVFDNYNAEIKVQFQVLNCACCNRFRISKNLLYHQWKIECAV